VTGRFPRGTPAILSPLPHERVIQRFAIALVTAVLAVLLRALLDPLLGHVSFYVTVYMTVALCAVVCGFFPAVLNGLLGFAGIFYWFVDPRYSFSVFRPAEIHGVIGFFLLCAVLTALGVANRTKQLRLDETLAAVTKEAGERKRAEEELQKAHAELERRVEERTAELSQTLERLESEIKAREETQEQLRVLSVRLMTLRDEERRRIARDLHDTTGQTLAAIKMTLSLLQQIGPRGSDLPRLVSELNALTTEALQEVRTTSYLLHPPLLDEAGIASAARWFVEGFAKRSGIRVQCGIPEQMERPPRDCELVLFRVLQESLTNVHRHSGATAATVILRADADELRLEVDDNGCGISEERLQRFNASAGGAGVGIAGMRERVRELGGRLEIQSDKTGTVVRATLPMVKPTADHEASLSISAA
jgi:signal transduction histidine kinase